MKRAPNEGEKYAYEVGQRFNQVQIIKVFEKGKRITAMCDCGNVFDRKVSATTPAPEMCKECFKQRNSQGAAGSTKANTNIREYTTDEAHMIADFVSKKKAS